MVDWAPSIDVTLKMKTKDEINVKKIKEIDPKFTFRKISV